MLVVSEKEVIAGQSAQPNKFQWCPLDREFDAAVLALASIACGGAVMVADDAPSSFEDLMRLLDSGEALKVWSGASELTIYGSPEVNYAFRGWHDMHHWRGRFPFTLVGEMQTAVAQVEELERVYAGHPRLRVWTCYIFAEIVGQALFAAVNGGRFPDNQRLFAKAFTAVLLAQEIEAPCAA